MYLVKKTDRRYSGHDRFKYVVTMRFDAGNIAWNFTQGRLIFQAWRTWCHHMFGEGMERDWACGLMHSGLIPMAQWAWDTEHGNRRLYLQGDEQLVMFQLKF